jgi:RimJ/RimL family protein N-acetyltransferase
MSVFTLSPLSHLSITANPRLNDLRHWWETRQADPDCAIAFADTAPTNFLELLERIVHRDYILYLATDPEESVVGAIWLHDLQCEPNGTPHTGWVGAYVLPEYRRSHAATILWFQSLVEFETIGVHHFYAAVHHENYRSQMYATRHMGLHLVNLYPDFTRFGGKWTDCLIYTLHPEDAHDAWMAATERNMELRPTARQPWA